MVETPLQADEEREKKNGRVLITGSKGTIGSLLTRGLAEKFDVLGLDLIGNPNLKTEFVVDISNIESLKSAFDAAGEIDFIVHLAGNPDENAHWEDILKNNIVGTRNIYECAQKYGVKRVIFASSTHLFGKYPQYPDKPSIEPISIDAARRPDGYYATSKGFGEDIARYYYDTYGLQTISIRIGCISPDNTCEKPYHLLWLSHNDAVQVFEKALLSEVEFGVYYAISVDDTIFDIEPTKTDLGFSPEGTPSKEK